MANKRRFEEEVYDSNGIQSEGLPNLTQIGTNELLPFLDSDGNLTHIRLSGTEFAVDGELPYTKTRRRLKGILLFKNAFHQLSGVKPGENSSVFTYSQPIIRVVQGGSGALQYAEKPETGKTFVRSLTQLREPF